MHMMTNTNWIYVREIFMPKVVCKSYVFSHIFKAAYEPT